MENILKIAGYNTHLFLPPRPFRDEERCNKIATSFNSYDVVGFCEAWSDDSKRKLCTPFKYKFFVDTNLFEMGSGLAVASKYPIYAPRLCLFKKLKGFDQIAEKGYLRVVVGTPFGSFRLYLTHTQADDEYRFTREKNLKQIADDIKEYETDLPVIIMGDMNVVGGSDEYSAMMKMFSGTTDTFHKLHPASPGYTYDKHNILVKKWDCKASSQRLDYILYLAKADWEPIESTVLTSIKLEDGAPCSDHYPLEGKLSLLKNVTYSDPLVFDNKEEAEKKVRALKTRYGAGKSALVVIHNRSSYQLNYSRDYNTESSGDHCSFYHNFPVSIPPGKFGCFLHVHPEGEPWGAEGAIIYQFETLGFEILLSWEIPWDDLFLTNKMLCKVGESGKYTDPAAIWTDVQDNGSNSGQKGFGSWSMETPASSPLIVVTVLKPSPS